MNIILEKIGFDPANLGEFDTWLDAYKNEPNRIPALRDFLNCSFGHYQDCKNGLVDCNITSLVGGKWYIDDVTWLLFCVALLNALKNNKAKPPFQEVIRNYDRIRPYFDLESDVRDITDDDINLIKEVFMRYYWRIYDQKEASKDGKWNIPHEEHIKVLRNIDNPTRRVHLHFPTLITTKMVLKYITETIRDEYKNVRDIIDPTLSGLRLVYCYKPNNALSVYQPSSIIDENIILDLIKYRVVAFNWEYEPPMVKQYIDKFSPRNIPTEYDATPDEIPESVYEKLWTYLKKEDFKLVKTDKGIALIRLNPSHCPICDRTHEKDNMSICWVKGVSYLKCFRLPKKSIKLQEKEWTEEEKEEFRQKTIESLRKQRQIFIPPSYMIVEEYNNRHTIPINPDYKINMMWSEMNTGKTTQLINYLKPKVENFEIASILFLSSKRTYSIFLEQSLKRELPSMDIYNYMHDNITNQDFVIVQVESLHKITKRYDIIVIDEITSIVKQMDSGLHGCNLLQNRKVFKQLIYDADRIICMDADIDERSYKVLHEYRPTDIIHLQRNMYRRGNRKILFYSKEYQHECEQKLFQLLKFYNKNVAIILGSLKDGERLALSLEDLGINYILLSKKNPVSAALNQLKQDFPEEFADHDPTITDLLMRYQVVMYTSTMTVGVDFNEKHFDCQFVFGHSMSNNVREVKQMMGRIRQLTDNEIYICNYTTNRNELIDYDKILQKQNNLINHNNALACTTLTNDECDLYLEEGKYIYKFKDNIWTWLNIQNEIENNISKNYYNDAFLWLLEDQKYQITHFQLPNNSTAIITSERNRISHCKKKKQQTKQVDTNELNLIQNAPIVSDKAYYKLKLENDQGRLNKLDAYTLQKNNIVRYVSPSEYSLVTAQEIVDITKYKSQLYNAKIEMDLTIKDQLFRDIVNSPNGKLPIFSKYHYIKLICDMLNISSSMDTTSIIHCKDIRPHFNTIKDLSNNIKLTFNLNISNKINDYNGLFRFINSIFTAWTGYKFKSDTENRREISWSNYKPILLNMYNVTTFEDLPAFEIAKYTNMKDSDTIRPISYTYKLVNQSKSFDIFLTRVCNYIRNKYKNISINQQYLSLSEQLSLDIADL